MENEKEINILRAASSHASVLVIYMEQGGTFPLPKSNEPLASGLGREIAAAGYFLGKVKIWQKLGGRVEGILTPIFKRATRPRHRAAFSSGTPLPQFSGTLRIVLNAENGCAVGGDRSGKVLSFFRRVVELTAEELKKIEG